MDTAVTTSVRFASPATAAAVTRSECLPAWIDCVATHTAGGLRKQVDVTARCAFSAKYIDKGSWTKAGAAIDVFAQEPPDPAHPLQSAPNALLTPHVAGLSDRALVRVATEAAKGILDVLQGRHPRSPVIPEIFPLQPR